MTDKDKKPPSSDAPNADKDDISADDFREVSKKLLGIYKPILEEELKRASTPDQLEKEAESPEDCQEELDLAGRIFNNFLTEDVALRLLPRQGRELLGPIERWRWCLLHIRCCIIFGWLLCRRQRTFRAFVYYAYRYWLCVRQALGTPVSSPPTDEEKRDLATLVRAIADAYKPYLTDQLATVEFPSGIPEEVLAGEIDCFEGEEETGAILDRFLTLETAPALLGKAAFEQHRKEPFFQFCRCWCLCSIRFGCCLARVHNLAGVLRCLRFYLRCLRDCFRPLICQIVRPAADSCADAVFVPGCSPPFGGVQIVGTAAGTSFNHYTLTYSFGGNPPVNDAVVYPDCTRPPANSSFNTPVFGGTLGYLDVGLLPPGVTEFTIFLDVFDSKGAHTLCTESFKLRTTAVEITAAAKVNALVAEDPFNAGSFIKLIKSVNNPSTAVPETSIGGFFSADGSAYTVGCDRIMTQFLLSRYSVNPLAPVPSFPSAGIPLLASGAVVYADIPGHPWSSGCFPVFTPNIILNGDLVAEWQSKDCFFIKPYTVPKVEALPFWDSTAFTGRFVIHLEVRDHLLPGGPFPGDIAAVDQVAVWIDNLLPIGVIKSIGGITGCGDLHLKNYLGTTAEIVGVAWDPPIDATAPQKAPNDNFGTYSMSFQKNGGGSGVIPIATPHVRVPNIWPGPLGGAVGTLTNWDIVAALDGGPGPLPPGSPKIVRGDRCAYVIVLEVSDNTHVGDSGNHNSTGPILYAINVINDIP